MDSSDLTQNEQMELFEKVIVSRLAETERRRLEVALRESEEVRANFRNYVWLHMELASATRMARARQAVYDEVRERAGAAEQLATASAKPIETKPIPEKQEPLRISQPITHETKFSRRVWACLLANAVAVTVLIGLSFLPSGNEVKSPVAAGVENRPTTVAVATPAVAVTRPPAPVATLTSNKNAVWQSAPLHAGAILREGDSLELSAGEIQLSVGYGAEILAKGPLSLTFLSHDCVKLNRGDIAVQVAEWAKGFTVATSAMDVVDLGTTFTVSASPKKGVETRVLKGLVRVHPHESDGEAQRGLLVSEGGAYLVDGQGRRWRAPRSQTAVDDEIDFGSFAPYHPVELQNTGLGFAVGDEDPHWQIVAGPEGTAWPQFASVCGGVSNYLPNDPQNSQWVSIARWRGAEAQSVFTFQTSFDLRGYDLSTIQFFGRFLADNGVREVRVNGNPVVLESWDDLYAFGHEQFRFVNVSEGLVAGENVIEIDVWNDSYVDRPREMPNPMALRVEWYAFGRQLDSATEATEKLGFAEADDSR